MYIREVAFKPGENHGAGQDGEQRCCTPEVAKAVRPIHVAHAALTERFEDLVMTECLADQSDGLLTWGIAVTLV